MNLLVACADRGVPLFGPSGASAHLRGIAAALVRAGHQVRVATPLAGDDRDQHSAFAAGIDAVHHDGRPWPRGIRRMGREFAVSRLKQKARRGWRIEGVWERHGPYGGGFAQGVPRVVELNAPWFLERARLHGAKSTRMEAFQETISLRTADRVLAVSRWLAAWAVDEKGCAPDRVHLVPNGVEPQPPADPDPIRRALGLSGPVVGFVGSFRPWHGVARIPRILDALGPRWTGLAVGAGPIRIRHPQLICTGQVAPDLVPALVAAMDVGLAPYPADAPPWFCPLKILDYRAQGVAVVATDVADCRALVGVGGEVLSTQDPGAWAAAIRRQHDARPAPWVRTWDEVVRESWPP